MHAQVGLSLSRLGRILELQGRLTEAEEALQQAANVQRKTLGTRGFGLVASQAELARTLIYLASVLKSQTGRLEEAEAVRREGLHHMKQSLGEQRPHVLSQTQDLARHLIGHVLGLDHVTCGGPAFCGTMDVMDIMHGLFIPAENLPISDCDLLGIAAVCTAPSCDEIPASIPYVCD